MTHPRYKLEEREKGEGGVRGVSVLQGVRQAAPPLAIWQFKYFLIAFRGIRPEEEEDEDEGDRNVTRTRPLTPSLLLRPLTTPRSATPLTVIPFLFFSVLFCFLLLCLFICVLLLFHCPLLSLRALDKFLRADEVGERRHVQTKVLK